MKNVVLLSKDVLRPDYLSCYGSREWNTPNIDDLARTGTVFRRHYTAAPSTAMAVTSMFTGLSPHSLNRKTYEEVEQFDESKTLFGILNESGYQTHVIWPGDYGERAGQYSKVFSRDSAIHGAGTTQYHIFPVKDGRREPLPTKGICTDDVLDSILAALDACLDGEEAVFVWMHLPHCLLGRTAYGADIDLFDRLVGKIRERFDRSGIYVTADHGHMNCQKGVPVYGFHVYEGAIRIPLISPRIEGQEEIQFPTSNTQLMSWVLGGRVRQSKYVYSDTQYYAQTNRKLAVIMGDYKYIYNKRTRTEELYDLDHDPSEEVNLLVESWYDRNRRGRYLLEEIYHYQSWNQAADAYLELRREKDRIWREGNWLDAAKEKLVWVKRRKSLPTALIPPWGKAVDGRWGARVMMPCYQE
jgi:arylsulfatase A-like enzyme